MKTNLLLLIFTLFVLAQGCKDHLECVNPIEVADTTTTPLQRNTITGWTAKSGGITGNLISVDFPSSKIGYISGLAGVVYKTIDSGVSYQSISPLAGYDYYALDFISETIGFVGNNNGLSGGYVYKTTDGGSSWSQLSVVPHIWRCIKFLDANIGFAGGGVDNNIPAYGGKLYRTADGGQNWTEIVISNLKVVRAIYFVDSNNGYMCADQGQLYKTTDGGLTWVSKAQNFSTSIPSAQLLSNSIYFKDPINGFSLTNTVFYNDVFLMKTSDGGDSWSRVSLPSSGFTTSNTYMSILFSDANTGYIIGGNVGNNKGAILKTTDGGSTWTSMTVNSSRLFGMSLIGPSEAFSVGFDATVLKGN